MLQRHINNPIIKPSMLTPSVEGYNVLGAFNPGATIYNNQIILFLIDAMKKFKKKFFIISQIEAKSKNTFPVYAPQHTDTAYRLFHVIEKTAPAIIHIEHEFGLYGSRKKFQIVYSILCWKLTNAPVVKILHTVHDNISYTTKIIVQHIIDNSSAVIVHEPYQKKYWKKI